ncbi:MAG: hypothetical protein F4237_13490 [Gemmatimonadetes bacterium]|nr:hypothetical protein [Gemmatimonadota bacterium]
MSHEDKAEELEHYMEEELDKKIAERRAGADGEAGSIITLDELEQERRSPRGTGNLFRPREDEFPPMPDKPTLLDFFRLRFAPANHVLQSATHALNTGQPERTVMACLMHDVVLNLIKVDHGWWGAQLVEPYVDERIAWGIRYHAALRFYPDEEYGYEYPEMYNRIFGHDYVPEPYIKEAYEYARKHRWYAEARLITVNDTYAFQDDMDVDIEVFTDIIGRNFKQPKEGLGYDNSPVAHMWRTIAFPNRPL